MRNLKRVSFIAASMVLSISSVAYGKSSSSSAPVTITFVAAQYSNNTQPYWQNLIKKFEKAYPNIKVNLQVVGWDVLDQKVSTMVATHQTPDLLNYNMYASFAADGLLEPISQEVPKNFLSGFYPSFLNSGQVQGTQYGLPLLATVRVLYYNKTLFKKAGIAQPPKTWPQLETDAIKITKKTGIPGFGLPMSNYEGQADFSYFIWGNGGTWKKNGKWDLNDPKNIQALQFMHKLTFTDHATNPQPTATNHDLLQPIFEQGKLGMLNTANFFATLIKQDGSKVDYGIAPIPVNTGVKPGSATLGVADYLMSFKTSQHPDAVGKFIQFFYQNKNYETFLKNEGMLPVTKSAGVDFSKASPLQAQFISMLPKAKFYPNSDPNILQAFSDIRQAGEEVMSNQATPQQALDQAQKQMAGN